MTLHPEDGVTIREYLLGNLAGEEERERVEERLLTDDEYFEELEIVKGELIDEYVGGALTNAERERFEQHFLTTRDRHRDVRLAEGVKEYAAKKKRADEKLDRVRPRLSWARAFSASPLVVAATLLVVAGLSFGVWRAFVYQSDVDKGLIALGIAYRDERPVEVRLTGLGYAPLPNTRGGVRKGDLNSAKRAAAILQDAANKHPGPASSHALGKLYLYEQQLDLAIANLEEALKADPNNAEINNDLGAAWLERGKDERQRGEPGGGFESFGRSRKYIERALELDSSLLEALFNRPLVREYMKVPLQAEDDWRAYLEKDSASPWASEARSRLELLKSQKNKATLDEKQAVLDFLAAMRAGDDETAWHLLMLARDISGSFIENKLLDDYLDSAAEGPALEVSEKLRTLSDVGHLEVAKGNDHFISDLVKFYSAATREQRVALAVGRARMRSGHKQILISTVAARESYAEATRIFEENGDKYDALSVRYGVGHSHLLDAQSLKGLSEFEAVQRESESGGYKWLLGQSLNGIANAHIGLNNYSQALEYSKHSLKILEQMDDVVGIMKVNDQLGLEYLRFSDYRKALTFHWRSLSLAGETSGSLPSWRTYILTAAPLNALGLTDAAIDFSRESLRLALNAGQPVNISRSYSSLGLMYANRRNYGEALKNINLALESGKSIPKQDMQRDAVAYSLLQLGNVHRLAGDFGKAVESYDQAIGFYEQLNFQAFSYAAHKGKLLACAAVADCHSFEQELETTLSLFEDHRQKIRETSNKHSFFDTEQSIYDLAIDFAYTAKNDPERAFDYSERCHARSLLDLKNASDQRRESLGVEETHPASTFEPVKLREIRERMPEQAQIVQYAVLNDKLLIWFVSKTRVESFRRDITAGELGEKVVNYLRVVSSPSKSDENEERRQAEDLYKILIAPVESLLDRQKQVCIILDKILGYLPFAALVSPASGKYLVENYALLHSPSSNVFIQSSEAARRKEGARPERLLSVGDPHFDARDFPTFRRLPAAGVEAKNIAAYYESKNVFTEDEATRERIEREMEAADVIHLATHYVADEQSPMYSKLLLAKDAPGDATPDNLRGVLLAHEIYGLKFPRTRLVVLSACATAAERYYGGEGMIGLSSPFITGGVPLVVASLWPVDSDSTAKLMTDFHRHRKQDGLSTAEALKRAQTEMLNDSRKDYGRPYHWASFITIGGYAEF
jgi:CHAT domain-containing protein/tetratricopeptide (TPR) repeat protein